MDDGVLKNTYNMKNIFYKSDLKIIEGYPGTDDFLYHYFTQKGRETYDVSLAIGNCRVFEDDNGDKKMVISLDSHGLNPGQLKVLREMNYDDTDFQDGEYNKKVESWYDVKLVNGRSDDDEPTIQYEGIFTAMRGEAGKDADVEAIRMEINRKAEEVLSAAKEYTDGSTAGLEDAKAYTDERDAVTLENAKTYTDTQDAEMLASAKAYTDESGATAANVLYFETIADFDNAKSGIQEKSLVYIEETGESSVFTPQKYNAKFVACEEWFADTALIGGIFGIDLTGKVMLTSVLHHFESFVVNGTEMVTGSETANEAGICPLLIDANLGDEFEVTFRFKENNEVAIIGAEFILAGFTFTPISELILREHDFTAYGDMSAKVFEAYQMYYNICLHKISICTSQKIGELSGELDSYGLLSHRVNFAGIMSGGQWRTTPIPEDAYVELSDNDAFGQAFVDGNSETDGGILTFMTMPKSFIAGNLGLSEELVHDVEVRRIHYINE